MNARTSAARTAILDRIDKALRTDEGAGSSASLESNGAKQVEITPVAVTGRLRERPRSTQPGFAGAGTDLTQALITNMEAAQMSVVRLQTRGDVPAAVADYLDAHAITGETTVAPALGTLPWPEHYATGSASGTEATSVTPCLAAVAETGSVVVASSPETPASLNFLPDNHLVVLHESQIVSHMEAIWPLLRALQPMPRATTLVTGPSRTADIEQTLEIGAHGPRRVHVMLVAEGQAAS